MRYSLEGELAKKYGIAEAFLLSYFQYYIEAAEKKQDPAKFHDGRYWTYASVREIERNMDFLTRSAIHRALAKLKECGLLLTGVFNKYAWDKTVWYTFSDRGWEEIRACPKSGQGVSNRDRGVSNRDRGVSNRDDNTYSIHLSNPLGSSGNKQTVNAEQVNEEANRYPGTKYDQETYSDAVSAYEKHIQTPLTANIVDEVCAMVDDWGLEAVKYGFKTAGRNGVRKLNYVETCARNYVTNKDKPKKTRAQGKPKNDVAGTVEAALKLLGVGEDE